MDSPWLKATHYTPAQSITYGMRRIILVLVFLVHFCSSFFSFSLVAQHCQRGGEDWRKWATAGDVEPLRSGSSSAGSSLKQVQIKYNCEEIDSDEISELLLEIGTLSVSCEVTSMKEGFLNEESNWHDLQSRKSWQGALLRANFPKTYDESVLIEMVKSSFPGVNMEILVEEVEDKNWIEHVQSSWRPQVIDDLTIRFPWHETEHIETPKELILEGGAAFGTGANERSGGRVACAGTDRWEFSSSRSGTQSRGGRQEGA